MGQGSHPMAVEEALERAFVLTESVLGHVRDGDLERPTACPGWDLRDLLGHVFGGTRAFGEVLHSGPLPARARVELEPDRVLQFTSLADRTIQGWRATGALDAEYPQEAIELDDGVLIPPIPLPGRLVASIELLDVGVHVLDIAEALGDRALAEDEALAAATLAAAQTILAPGIRELAGFADARDVDPDASAVGRLLAFTGRATD
jgi:uncharacterized protein (TIGR03086 family)